MLLCFVFESGILDNGVSTTAKGDKSTFSGNAARILQISKSMRVKVINLQRRFYIVKSVNILSSMKKVKIILKMTSYSAQI